ERRAHRAVRKRTARALPRGWRFEDGHESAGQTQGCADLARENHGEIEYLRKARTPGRPHTYPDAAFREVEGSRFPRFRSAVSLWREDRAPVARQRKPDVRHDAAGF